MDVVCNGVRDGRGWRVCMTLILLEIDGWWLLLSDVNTPGRSTLDALQYLINLQLGSVLSHVSSNAHS